MSRVRSIAEGMACRVAEFMLGGILAERLMPRIAPDMPRRCAARRRDARCELVHDHAGAHVDRRVGLIWGARGGTVRERWHLSELRAICELERAQHHRQLADASARLTAQDRELRELREQRDAYKAEREQLERAVRS